MLTDKIFTKKEILMHILMTLFPFLKYMPKTFSLTI